MKKIIYTLSNGDDVVLNSKLKSIVVYFKEQRKVISTSVLNGAYSECFSGVFNHNCGEDGKKGHCELKAATYEEHLRVLATELELNPDCSTGMGTAAKMENSVIVEKNYQELTVTAIVTGGVESNGGRAGDPSDYYVPKEKLAQHNPGTINIILVIDANLPAGILTRALVTCTEAKSVALQELMAGSLYSNGLATGSGTDQTIIIANPQSTLYFESAGKHCKLGELIGLAVKEAVTKALFKQSGLSPAMQYSMLRRFQRFGISKEVLWQEYPDKNISEEEFYLKINGLSTNHKLVAISSLYVHLLDQYNWGLLPWDDVKIEAEAILLRVAQLFQVNHPTIEGRTLKNLLAAWSQLMLHCVLNKNNR